MPLRLLGLFVLALVCFGRAIPNPPLVDDRALLTQQPDVVEPAGVWRLWTRNYWGPLLPEGQALHYRPLAILSLNLTARATPAVARIVNLALLALLGALFACWLTRHTGPGPAWVAAALAVAHPANHVHATQIVGRSDLQSWLGILCVALLLTRALERGRWRAWELPATLAAAALAVGSKESGLLVWPVAVAVARIHWQPGRRDVLVPLVSVLLLVTVAAIVGRLVAVGTLLPRDGAFLAGVAANPLEHLPAAERLPGALSAVAVYGRLVVWPDHAFYHHPDAAPGWGAPAVVGLLVLLALGVGLALALRRGHASALPLTLALGQLLLVGNLLFGVGVYAANRLALPLVLGAAGGLALLRRPRAAGVVVAAFVLAWMPRTWWTCGCWADGTTAHVPDRTLHPERTAGLGANGLELAKAGDPRAIAVLGEAVRRQPDWVRCRLVLAGRLRAAGRADEARPHLRRVAEGLGSPSAVLRHHAVTATIQLAAIDVDAGRLARAAAHVERALAVSPGEATGHALRTLLAVRRGKSEQAQLEALLGWLEAAPEDPGALRERARQFAVWRQRGRTALVAGQHARAIPALRQALRLQPDDGAVAFDLARACDEAGDPMTVAAYRAARALRPDHVPTLAYLAARLRRDGAADAAAVAAEARAKARGTRHEPLVRRVLGSAD